MASDFAKKIIKRHEGIRLKLYNDSLGIPTIGVGRNLKHKGISIEEAQFMFENDIIDAEITLGNIFGLGIFNESENRVSALLDMAFNLGENGLRKFTKMVEAIKIRDWNKAAEEAEDSIWFKQVGNRAVEIVTLLKDKKE